MNSQDSEEPIAPKDPTKWWQNKDQRNSLLLGQAQRALMLAKIEKQNQIVRNTVRGMQGDAGMDMEDAEAPVDINIGNETHYHTELQSAPQSPEKGDSGIPGDSKNGILPYLLAAAIGVPLTIAAWNLTAIFGAPETPHTTDTDTWNTIVADDD